MINLPILKIGGLEINLIQGGMGVGISGQNLASAVANCGGAGIIAGVGLGINYPGNYRESNNEGLRQEIRGARKKSNGIIGVNIMHALSNYSDLVKIAVEENVDMIISGAGIPKDLPAYIGEKNIKLIPIVSDVRVARTISKAWKKYNKIPDAIIVEGPMAGGHLGYSYDDLISNTTPTLERIATGVIDFVSSNFDKPIPVIVAGGIYDGSDIAYFINKIRATGVQMATRFVPTLECDASDLFKQTYLNAKKEDITIIKSPVGLPGRAIKNEFLERIQRGERDKFGCHYKCLKTCEPANSPYCIAKAMFEAKEGKFDKGFAFTGTNVYRCTPETCLDENKKFIPVGTLMQRLSDEYNSAK